MSLNTCCPLLLIVLGIALIWAVAVSAIAAEMYFKPSCCTGTSGALTFPIPDTVFKLINSVGSLFKFDMSSVHIGNNVTFIPLTHVDALNTQVIFPAPNKPDLTDFDFVVYLVSTQTLLNKTINGGDLRNCILSGDAATLVEGANIVPGTAILAPSSSKSGGIISGEIASPIPSPPNNFWEITVNFSSAFSSVSTVQITPSSTDSALMGPYCVYNISTTGFTIRQYVITAPPALTLISLFSYRVN